MLGLLLSGGRGRYRPCSAGPRAQAVGGRHKLHRFARRRCLAELRAVARVLRRRFRHEGGGSTTSSGRVYRVYQACGDHVPRAGRDVDMDETSQWRRILSVARWPGLQIVFRNEQVCDRGGSATEAERAESAPGSQRMNGDFIGGSVELTGHSCSWPSRRAGSSDWSQRRRSECRRRAWPEGPLSCATRSTWIHLRDQRQRLLKEFMDS